MTSKPILPRELASRDVEDVVDCYLSEAGEQVAFGFIEALEHAYLQLANQPTIGSPRYAHELHLPGLRSWPLQRYSCLIFYVDLPNHIDVWRVPLSQRDIPAWLCEDNDSPPGEPL